MKGHVMTFAFCQGTPTESITLGRVDRRVFVVSTKIDERMVCEHLRPL